MYRQRGRTHTVALGAVAVMAAGVVALLAGLSGQLGGMALAAEFAVALTASGGVLLGAAGQRVLAARRHRPQALAAARLREMAEGVHGIEALFDRDGRLLWVSPSIARLVGWAPADLVGQPEVLARVIEPLDYPYCKQILQQVLADGQARDAELRLLGADGAVRWVATHWRRQTSGDGVPEGVRMSAEDIQARKETEYKLLETVAEMRRSDALREHYLSRSNDERMRLAALLNVIRLGILFMDRDHRVLYFNRAMLDIWGFPAHENLIGMRDAALQQHVAPLLVDAEGYFVALRETLARRDDVGDMHEVRFRDGRIVTDRSAVVEDGHGRGIGRVWIYEDITEQRKTAEQLVAMAERDPLTNLFNRRRFHEELQRFLFDTDRSGHATGLIVIDLDGFKPINDDFGHQAGDEVLVTLARQVGGVIRRNEIFFRMGGDEFCVLVPLADARGLGELAQRIVDTIAALPLSFDGRAAHLTASLGTALYPGDAGDGEHLLAAADKAMYAAKSAGGNRFVAANALRH